jgi:large subunit ribosomal protein L29
MAIETLTLQQIRDMTDVELHAKVAEVEKERYGLRFKAGTEVLANPMDLRNARRQVARLKTVLAERAAAAQKAK